MTIARNIEANSKNWIDSTHLQNGISDDLTNGCDGNPDGEWGVSSADESCTRRVFTLSNSETLYDVAGNVWSHVNKANTTDPAGTGYNVGQTSLSGCSTPGSWSEWKTCTDKSWMSANQALDGANGIGRIHYSQGVPNNVFLRGAGANDASYAGVFALYLLWHATTANPTVGFRCTK